MPPETNPAFTRWVLEDGDHLIFGCDAVDSTSSDLMRIHVDQQENGIYKRGAFSRAEL